MVALTAGPALVAGACSDRDFVPLEVGQCLPDGANVEGERAQRLTIVNCAERHRYEVFAVERLDPPSEDWPGENLVTLNAENRCIGAIEAATGLKAKDTPDDVELVHVDPTEDSWRGGDRDVECLFRWDEPTTDTLVQAGD